MPKIAFSFDAENREAQRAAQRRAADLVKGVSASTKVALRKVIVQAIRDGVPPYDAARMIRGMVGMNPQQAMAAYKYRQKLINSGLSIERVDSKVERYEKKLIRQRGITIARTEIMSSLAEGAENSWFQAQGQGMLGKDAKKEWITTPIDACNICRPLDGQQVLLAESFQSIVGPILRPTAHPRCRCAVAPVPGVGGMIAQPQVAGITQAPITQAPIARAPKPRRQPRAKPRRQPAVQSTRPVDIVGGSHPDDMLGPVLEQKEIAVGTSSETLLVEGKGFKGVFKPQAGEGFVDDAGDWIRDTITNRKFTLAQREKMAQELDRRLGTNMIPDVKIRDVKGRGQGSIQRFVDDAKTADDLHPTLLDEMNLIEDLERQFILDVLIGNTDRHSSNWMVKNIGGRHRVVSIDNGLTFPKAARTLGGTGDADILGLMEFRNETTSFLRFGLKQSGGKMTPALRTKLINNIDALDVDKFIRNFGQNMSKFEESAFRARVKFVRQALDEDTLFTKTGWFGEDQYGDFGWWDVEFIPGIAPPPRSATKPRTWIDRLAKAAEAQQGKK